MTVGEIAEWLNGSVDGNPSSVIDRVAKIEEAGPSALAFLANPKYEKFLETTQASAVLVARTLDLSRHARRPSLTFIRVDDPYSSFVRVLERLTPSEDSLPQSTHPSAWVAPSARLGKNVILGAHVVIDEEAVVGDGTVVSHGSVIGRKTVVGPACRIYPGVVVYHACRIGARVTLHAGVVIGGDGFGFAPQPDGSYEKIPQLGIVTVGDDVEVGANTTIDRATLGETRIGNGVKLDNLVQIAHNCVIGDHTVIAAQTGVSGSTRIGRSCMIAGQVGIGGHLEVADGTILLGQTGVTKSITEPGKTWFGTPLREQKRYARIEAALRSLPELSADFYRLQREVQELRELLGKKSGS